MIQKMQLSRTPENNAKSGALESTSATTTYHRSYSRILGQTFGLTDRYPIPHVALECRAGCDRKSRATFTGHRRTNHYRIG
jgi:hypothetical protein